MSDPITVGAVTSLVLSMASEQALKGFVGEAAKDAYKALKGKIAHWAGGDVEALEKDPTSVGRRSVIAETIDKLPEAEKISVKELATQLADALKKSAAEGPIAFDFGTLEAARIHLGKITVHQGKGMVAKTATADEFAVDELTVGDLPGKTRQ